MKLIILTFGIAAAVPATIQTDDKKVIASGETGTKKQAKSVEKAVRPKDATALVSVGVASCLTEEGCRASATELALKLGGGGYAFAGTYATKGCYTYNSGNYQGMAFFGTGGSVADMEQIVSAPKQRVYEYSGKIKELWEGGGCHSSSKEFARLDNVENVADHKMCANVCNGKNPKRSYYLFGIGIDGDGQCICMQDRCTKDNGLNVFNYYEIGENDFVKCIDTDSGDNQYGAGNEREVCPLGCYQKCLNHGCNHPGAVDTVYYDCAEGIYRQHDMGGGKTWESTSDCCEHEDKLKDACGKQASTCVTKAK
jgi:hypothetical protein